MPSWLADAIRAAPAILVGLMLAVLCVVPADGRSRHVATEFQREHPCPSAGKTRGACPGYVKDHVTPLCAGGADAVSNMQWQTVADGKAKDRWERSLCRH
jgi:hypothetical protein